MRSVWPKRRPTRTCSNRWMNCQSQALGRLRCISCGRFYDSRAPLHEIPCRSVVLDQSDTPPSHGTRRACFGSPWSISLRQASGTVGEPWRQPTRIRRLGGQEPLVRQAPCTGDHSGCSRRRRPHASRRSVRKGDGDRPRRASYPMRGGMVGIARIESYPIDLQIVVAEEVRFELTEGCPSPVFKTGAFNRSATPPAARNYRRSLDQPKPSG
jgi:hypothetical protein